MIKLEVNEFLFEVKEEIMCYEELGEKYANLWEENFNKWLINPKIKKKYIKVDKIKNKTYYLIEDESDVFGIVDSYYIAVEENKIEAYWNKFE
ncbi:MAG: hypothetical protein R3Y29_01955 [bacterium]